MDVDEEVVRGFNTRQIQIPDGNGLRAARLLDEGELLGRGTRKLALLHDTQYRKPCIKSLFIQTRGF